MVVVWSANHFYYNGELFSCLLYFSLEAIFCPPVKPGVAFGPTNAKRRFEFLQICVYILFMSATGAVDTAAFGAITGTAIGAADAFFTVFLCLVYIPGSTAQNGYDQYEHNKIYQTHIIFSRKARIHPSVSGPYGHKAPQAPQQRQPQTSSLQ